jgi:hypothetical protein
MDDGNILTITQPFPFSLLFILQVKENKKYGEDLDQI